MLASKTAREAGGCLSCHLAPAGPGPPRAGGWASSGSGRKPVPPLTPAGPAGEMAPRLVHLTSGHQPPPTAPRDPKPVFQASGVCRSDVLTAQVAKATNTRHMSFWLKVNEVRGPQGFSRKEKHVLSSHSSTETRLPWDTSVWGHVCLGTRLPWDTFSKSHLPRDASVPRHRAECGTVESGRCGGAAPWLPREPPEGA